MVAGSTGRLYEVLKKDGNNKQQTLPLSLALSFEVCGEIRLSVEFVTVGFLRICRHSCCDWFPGIRGWCPGVLMRLRLKGALRLMSVENLSTGIEASGTGESLNSGDPAVHPAARHNIDINNYGFCWRNFGGEIWT